MASGSDKPQLPRGLIGRTGTPSGKGTRLPSLKGPRDLTLGGIPKKVFTPNIPARREKKESQTEASDQSTSKEKKPKILEEGKGGHKTRGRGRGRGRESNVIQSHSIFEQGPTEKTIKSGSSYEPGERSGGGGGGGGGGSRITVKKEKDTMTKEVLDNLLRDDFVEFRQEDPDVTLLPVKLPLQIKTELDVKSDHDNQFTQVKVKSEPMDTDEVVRPKVATEEDKPKVFNNKQSTRPVTCTDLFGNPEKMDSDQLLFFQLPDSLPGLPASTDDDYKQKKNKNKKDQAQDESLEKKMNSCNLEDFSEGLIGKLIVRKSGKVQMMLGQTLLDVEMGTPCGFLQDLVSVQVNGDQGDLSVLGHVDHRLVCTPDFEALLDNS